VRWNEAMNLRGTGSGAKRDVRLAWAGSKKSLISSSTCRLGLILRLVTLDLTEPLGHLREPSIKTEEGCAALSLCQVKGVRKVHPLGHPV
jgi:hypothetical protein